ncbi:MAG: SdpI family protein [Bacteroidetes bacterium]|nr:SdpI family protein [Bacteroidota bacterium]
MTWNVKREIVPLGMLIAMVVLALVFGPDLPERVPSHFDVEGMPDDTMSRTMFLFGIPAGVALLYLLLTFLPTIDPLWKRIKPRYPVLLLLRDFVVGFLLMMYIITIIAVKEGRLSLVAMGVGLGILFALIGNYLPKVPRNWFFGIRTPWTLASEEVWKKTHVVGGWMFVASGILTAILSFAGYPLHIVVACTLVPTIVITGFVYPFFLFRKLQAHEDAAKGEAPGGGY